MLKKIGVLVILIISSFGCSIYGARPQEVMDRQYHIEQVKIVSGDGSSILAGEFTKPYGDGPFPAVVLITGTGPQNRDEQIFGHKPFLVLSDHLTQKGIAVLRYDDRGVGESSGYFKTATAADFAIDAVAAFSFLKKRADISEIGFIGHSEGGYIAPLASLNVPSDFMVFMASPAKKLLPDTMVDQYEDMLIAAGESPGKLDIASALTVDISEILKNSNDLKVARKEIKKRLASVTIMSARDRRNWLNTYANPWAMWYANYDPEPTLTSYKKPVLALFGGSDLQVSAIKNAPVIKSFLWNKKSVVKIFDSLNHLFQFSKTGLIKEYPLIETTIEPVVLDTISAWINSIVGKEIERT